MGMPFEDEDEERDEILKSLSGEVDDYAGKQLPEEKSGGKITGIEISIKPVTGAADDPINEKDPEDAEEKGIEGEEGKGNEELNEDENDAMISHVLGMCGGGCAYCKGGMVEK
jgi:hypothetical protein